ncbi:MAG: GAF domain-containing protein [Chlorobiaceae bacterium]
MSFQALLDSNRKVTFMLTRINNFDHLLSHITELETGPRGYVITGNEHYLGPYYAALSADGIRLNLHDLGRVITDDPVQQRYMATLEPLIQKKIKFMARVVDYRKNRGFDATRALIATDAGNNMMEDIRRLIAVMKQRDTGFMQRASEASTTGLQHTVFSIVSGAFLSLSLLFLSLLSLNREVGKRTRIGVELEKINTELDQRVETRTAALKEEINKRIEEEIKVRRLSRLYAMLSKINEAIILVKEREVLFKTVCRVAVDQGKLGLAWIGILNNETGEVTPTVVGDEGFLLPPLHPVNIKEAPFDNGIMGTAVKTGGVACCKNIQTAPAMRHWQGIAIAGGFHSAAAVPFRMNGVIVALLNIYAEEVDFFTDDQINLLKEVESDVSFALETMMLEENHKKGEEALRKSERQFREMFENSSAVIFTFEPTTGRIVDANQSAIDFYGWPKDEFLSMYLSEIDILPPEELQHLVKQALSRDNKRFLVRHRMANGSMRDVEVFPSKVEVNGKLLMYSFINDITLRLLYESVTAFHLLILQNAQNKTVNELLQLTIDEAERLTQSSVGFLHFVGENQTTLSLQAWSTNTVTNVCNAEGMNGPYALNEAGVWADALRGRKAVIHNDFAAIKYRKGMPEGHLELKREAVLPIFRNDKIIALLGVGNKPHDYTDEDITILGMISDVAWDVIAKKISEEEHKILELQNYVIEHLAMHDSLTGLPNRRLLSERLSLTLAQCRRNKTTGALFVFDLDRFKIVNDTLGHAVGDLLLKEVATRTLGVLRRSGDSLVRLGGDEYVV